MRLFKIDFQVLKFLEEEIQSFEKLFEELNGKLIRDAVKNVLADFFRKGGTPPPPTPP